MASPSANPEPSSSRQAMSVEISAADREAVAIEPNLTEEEVSQPNLSERIHLNFSKYSSSADSAYESEVASYTTSLASSVVDYKFHHGRRYHAYKEGSYIFPNDEKESDRLDIVHKMTDVAMRGQIHFAPLSNPKRILDLGTGTGIWAMDIGDKFPQADVLGNDLSAIQPRWVPPNVHFEIDDMEAQWTYATKFDYIHARNLYSAILDWPRLMKQTFDNVNPGGYAEFNDYDIEWTSPDGTLLPDSPLGKVNQQVIKLSEKAGREPSPGPLLEGWMKDAGFVDVVAEKIPMPVGTWAVDKRLKEVGAWNYLQLSEGCDGMITYLFSRELGYSKEELEVLSASLRKQLKDPKVHGFFWMYNVYGRVPLGKQKEEEIK